MRQVKKCATDACAGTPRPGEVHMGGDKLACQRRRIVEICRDDVESASWG